MVESGAGRATEARTTVGRMAGSERGVNVATASSAREADSVERQARRRPCMTARRASRQARARASLAATFTV